MDTKKYRTGLKRLWAAIIDGIVFMPLLLFEQWIYKTTNNVSLYFSPGRHFLYLHQLFIQSFYILNLDRHMESGLLELK